MADSKITALTALTAADPANDMMPIVDVSDTSMAASGTTKRISINNILACSPSATLASLNVTGSSIPANGLYLPTTNTLEFSANSLAQYRIAPLGVFSWYDGAGGTRMTLNSTGLGVGTGPTYNIDVLGATLPTIAVRATSAGASNARMYLECAGTNSGHITYNRSLQALTLGATGGTTAQVTLDSTGNVGIGVTPSAGKGCLQLSSGINFPATQVASSDANTLDDYKEATWSPVITAGSGTPTTVTVNSAVYTKIGRVVVCTFDFSIVDKGTASSSLQFGLPVTSITSTAFCGSFREDGSTGTMGMVIYSTGTTAACLLYNNATPWVNGYRLKGTYTYFAA